YQRARRGCPSPYHETIEEELEYLLLIQAPPDGESEQFWQHNLRINPLPTADEMRYALSRVAYYTHQGLRSERAREASQPFPQRCEHCGVSLAFFPAGEEDQAPQQLLPLTASQIPPGTISIQAARRFFEALFPQTGFEKWRVEIDSTAGCGRIEQGLRCLFFQDRSSSLKRSNNSSRTSWQGTPRVASPTN